MKNMTPPVASPAIYLDAEPSGYVTAGIYRRF
jgi:hypothetical protein